MSIKVQRPAASSPCTKVCQIDDAGLCRGCHRTIDEIMNWGAMSEDARRALMAELPRRRIARAS